MPTLTPQQFSDKWERADLKERDAWLNPPGLPEPALKQRTLTNLYNALQVFRGEDSVLDGGAELPGFSVAVREIFQA